ncbi:peptidoglycan/LPS O-acetylase OafA/YrhL [Nocardioides zeae]|uniref:Peptidoglycan/LPS O-acetylase OafA/YrhL n=1 Tax=Nocardioides zeae TaxID=1457234 RepID=A0ACC6ICM5_9ACTN|nr:hypothetical protein [Nocardioides zeae]MDR6175544.1 peptidoglycan/LPS O-acetylase OafA/YrhL [Nocardioides zeae]MDR6208475.1 peptidoglycan/LPS O-acetylase OafA/YrhL [Nocardioides zeae]
MKTEHGIPIPRPAAALLVAGYAAAMSAWVMFVIDSLEHRPVLVSVAAGLAACFFLAAYVLMAETRRQTRVLRAALGYRRGERPWTWRQHVLNAVAVGCLLLGACLGLLSDADATWAYFILGYGVVASGLLAVSAVQKRRHERSDRERFGSPAAYEAARRFH